MKGLGSRTILLALGALSCLNMQSLASFEELLLIPWGSGPGKVVNRSEPSGRYGPTDFVVRTADQDSTGGRYLYLLDREQQLLQVFDIRRRTAVAALPIPPHSERLSVSSDAIAVWDGIALHTARWGDQWESTGGDYPFRTIQRLLLQDEELLASDEQGQWYLVTETGKVVSRNSIRRVDPPLPAISKLSATTFKVSRGNIDLFHSSHDKELGAFEYAGIVDDIHVFLTEEILSHTPIEAHEIILLFSAEGTKIGSIKVPFVYFSWVPRNVAVFDGTLYVLISSPRGLHLFGVGKGQLISGEPSFPLFPEEPYHFNDYLPLALEAEEGDGQLRDEDPLSRTDMMAIAREYIDLEWTATSANITDGIENVGGHLVRTPSWVTVGPKRKIPYKWGGFTSTATFAAGVPAGKKCGDDYTEDVSWGDTYCIGVDCSGFVSRCWNTDIKYGTSTLQGITTELPSVNDLRKGDCLNLVGSHVRLCMEDNPAGMVLTAEAAANDWRVSYRAFKLTELSSYVPRRFNWVIEEDHLENPFVIKVKDWRESLNVRQGPSTNEDIITIIDSEQVFVSTCSHEGWYHLHLPAGTGDYDGWAFGGSTSTDGYLEGSQGTPIACVTVEALNVRTGPGTEFSVLTTVSEGQRFAVLDSSGWWYQIQLANVSGSDTGWSSGGDAGQFLSVSSGGPSNGYGATIVSLSAPADLDERESAFCTMLVTNTGLCSWDSATLLRTTVSRERSSWFAAESWMDSSTVSTLGVAVLPHQTHTLTFEIKAPMVPENTQFVEHFGIVQDGFCWFGDPEQFGPSDEDIAFPITVHDIGLPPAPEIVAAGVLGYSMTITWNPVAEATHYGVFRGDFEHQPIPRLIITAAGPTFTSSYGVQNPALNVFYQIRAYAVTDSSELSAQVGEFDYAG